MSWLQLILIMMLIEHVGIADLPWWGYVLAIFFTLIDFIAFVVAAEA
jgi:hypothetical protein